MKKPEVGPIKNIFYGTLTCLAIIAALTLAASIVIAAVRLAYYWLKLIGV